MDVVQQCGFWAAVPEDGTDNMDDSPGGALYRQHRLTQPEVTSEPASGKGQIFENQLW